MAKSGKPSEQSGKVKFRIIEFELEGSDTTLQDSLKNIAAAFLRSGTATSKPIKYENNRQLEGDPSAAGDDVDVEVDSNDIEDVASIPKTKKSATSKKVSPAKILTDIRLDDVSPTLKEFCAKKSPSSDLSKYLVIANWFKHYKNLPDLTPDHFHTAYRFLGWSTPRDPAQPIRDLRHSRRGKFSAGSSPGTSTINHVGENSVTEMGNTGE